MKIMNINEINEYPENYDFLTDEQKHTILDYFKYQQCLADTYYEKHIIEIGMKDTYLKLYDHVMDLMIGAKELLAALGVFIEYSWPNSPGKWDFATRQDAIDRENNSSYYETCQNQSIKSTPRSKRPGFAAWPAPKQLS